MKKIKRKFLLGAIVVVLILVLPILVYVAGRVQRIGKQAAFGQVTLNVVPTEITKNIGEPFTIEIHANSVDKPVSAIKVSLDAKRGDLIVQQVVGAVATGDSFTDLVYDKNQDPFSFTVVARKPTASLPTGSFKVASVTLLPFAGGTQTLGINAEQSEAVGYNGSSQDVALTVIRGATISYTIVGSLCKIQQCVPATSISVSPLLRTDNKYNVSVSFTSNSPDAKLFKIYRALGGTVPDSHPETNLAGLSSPLDTSASALLFTDTNNTQGFAGETNLHYDVDGYAFCSVPATVTPQPTSLTPTMTSTPTPTSLTPTAAPALVTVTPTGGIQ